MQIVWNGGVVASGSGFMNGTYPYSSTACTFVNSIIKTSGTQPNTLKMQVRYTDGSSGTATASYYLTVVKVG
jgi:hypothetical protein